MLPTLSIEGELSEITGGTSGTRDIMSNRVFSLFLISPSPLLLTLPFPLFPYRAVKNCDGRKY